MEHCLYLSLLQMQSDIFFHIKRYSFSKFFSIYDVFLVCRMSEPFLKVETKREDESSDESSSDEEKKKRFSSQQVLKNAFISVKVFKPKSSKFV
jgi:hypothetical protein